MRNMELLAKICEEEMEELQKIDEMKKATKGGDDIADLLTGEKQLNTNSESVENEETESENEN